MGTEEGSKGSETSVIVYTKPDCPDCFNAKRYLSNRNVAYDSRDITNREIVEELLDRLGPGNYATPIIVAGEQVFFGFAANKEHLSNILAEMGL
jgi:glutaredoxin-like protein NrdH